MQITLVLLNPRLLNFFSQFSVTHSSLKFVKLERKLKRNLQNPSFLHPYKLFLIYREHFWKAPPATLQTYLSFSPFETLFIRWWYNFDDFLVQIDEIAKYRCRCYLGLCLEIVESMNKASALFYDQSELWNSKRLHRKHFEVSFFLFFYSTFFLFLEFRVPSLQYFHSVHIP